MSWIDVSVPLGPEMITWPGDPVFRSELTSAMARGDTCNVTQLDMGAHAGTHIDAPFHFIDGAAGADQAPLDVLMGPAWVVDARGVSGAIDAAALDRLGLPPDETRLLFRTTNGTLWSKGEFDPGFVAVTGNGAEALVARGVRLVGADYLSIAPFDAPVPTHRTLLAAGVIVLEGLDLREVEPGPYELICLPLRVVDSDGGPARALLRPLSGLRNSSR